MNARASARKPSGSAASWSSDSARPWVAFTRAPLSARTSLASWLPETQRAVPAWTMAITRRSTPGVSGPRSTRSPTNTAVRPSGWWTPSQPSSARSVSSSARQPCTSPMTSNGPVRSRRSFQDRSVLTVAASTSSTPLRTWTRRKPSLRIPFRDRFRSRYWRATTWAPNWRSGRAALRSCATRSGTSSTTASTSTSCSLARRTSSLRAKGWTLVASTTVSRPRRRRVPTTYCRTSKASLVADWSSGSFETTPR